MPARTITIAVDFDGTLVETDDIGALHPIAGAAEAMTLLRRAGYRITIHTCRIGIAEAAGRLTDEIRTISETLDEFGIPYDDIHIGDKPVAHVYVDDRAVGFKGNWEQSVAAVQALLSRIKR